MGVSDHRGDGFSPKAPRDTPHFAPGNSPGDPLPNGEKDITKKGADAMNQEAKTPLLTLIWEGDDTLPALTTAIARGASEAGGVAEAGGISEARGVPDAGNIAEAGDISCAGDVSKAGGASDTGTVSIVCCDLASDGMEKAAALLEQCDGVLFGLTGKAANLRRLIAGWDGKPGKSASVFYAARAVTEADRLRSLLKLQGFDLELQSFFWGWAPGEKELRDAENFGFAVGCALLHVPNPRRPRLVKCLVCGEIFDASLGICPVCGVGLDQCVPVEEDAVAFRRDTDTRYVILGGGIAAVSAADAIRRRDHTGPVTIFSAEEDLPIRRPMLTKDFDEALGDLSLHPAQWYSGQGITLRLGCAVTAVDTAAKTVTPRHGETVPYDKLIFATGAECFVPPFEGHDRSNVFTIRHQADIRQIAQAMKGDKRIREAVVIGGGVLGLEAASELYRSGLKLTVLEAAPQILGRQVDAATAARLREHLASMGVLCLEGVSIQAVREDGVHLSDGRVFPAQLVVVSCGNRANIAEARAAGVQTDRAIVADRHMATNLPDIYACGDCAQVDGINLQLWAEADAQGKIAGANAAGERLCYAPQLLGLSLEGFGISLFAAGDVGKSGKPTRTVEIADHVAHAHETYRFYGGALEGVILLNRPDKIAVMTRAVAEHARYEELFGKL